MMRFISYCVLVLLLLVGALVAWNAPTTALCLALAAVISLLYGADLRAEDAERRADKAERELVRYRERIHEAFHFDAKTTEWLFDNRKDREK